MPSRVMLARLRRIGAAALLPVLAAAAQAQTIPAEYLAIERQACNESCTQAGSPAAWCKRYCDCSIGKLKAEIPFETYSGIGQAAVKDAPQPPGVTDKLAEIAASCAKQTQ